MDILDLAKNSIMKGKYLAFSAEVKSFLSRLLNSGKLLARGNIDIRHKYKPDCC